MLRFIIAGESNGVAKLNIVIITPGAFCIVTCYENSFGRNIDVYAISFCGLNTDLRERRIAENRGKKTQSKDCS